MTTFVRRGHWRDGKWVNPHEVGRAGRSLQMVPTDLEPGGISASLDVPSFDGTYEQAARSLDGMKVGTKAATDSTVELVERLFGDEEGLSVNARLRRFREASRLAAALSDLETTYAHGLFDTAGTKPVGTLHGRVVASVGRDRDEWDQEKLQAYLVYVAELDHAERQTDGRRASPERAVVDATKALTTKGTWRTNALRQERLDPREFAERLPTLDADGNVVLSLVPSSEEESTDPEMLFRSTLVEKMSPTGKENATQFAKRWVHVSSVRAKAREMADVHSQKAAAQIGQGGGKNVPGVGHYEAKESTQWLKWQHDQLWEAVAAELEKSAPAGPQSQRFRTAVERIGRMKSLRGAKTPLREAGVLDEMVTSYRGRVSVKMAD